MSPKDSPPAFSSGNPEMSFGESALSTVSGSISPESSAADTVTTFIVEPGWYVPWVARLKRAGHVGEVVRRS